MKTRTCLWLRVVVCSLFLLQPVSPLASQSLTLLDTLPGHSSSGATAVAAGGGVVVGWSETPGGELRAFRWTPAGGMQELIYAGSSQSIAYGVSADGSTAVGYALVPGGSRILRWRADTGVENLGNVPNYTASGAALGASADGSVVVGFVTHPRGFQRGFHWITGGGMMNLGSLGGTSLNDQSAANGVSLDGTFVVGWTRVAASDTDYRHTAAFIWTEANGMQSLGGLPEASLYFDRSSASAVIPDGTIVAGKVRTASGQWHAGRWVAGTGWSDLGTLGGSLSEASGISASGTVVVGWSAIPSGDFHAFRWTPERGMEDLNTVYASLLQGVELETATAISPDGRFIVGRARIMADNRHQAYLLDTDEVQDVQIRATTHLDGFVGDPVSLPVHVELRSPGQSTPVQQYTVNLGSNGEFSLTTQMNGIWDVSVTVPHFLRRTVHKALAFGRLHLSLYLINGDIDGDNEVTLFDFGRLVTAFGSMPGDANWDANADLDGDGEVSLFDFGVLVQNFGAIGDE
ncbi:MAG: hypothetical protein HPY54_03015 [Chthonomonadetes bacterium]|nr:hypothetical protein [Chthonomonadetes bacterium]